MGRWILKYAKIGILITLFICEGTMHAQVPSVFGLMKGGAGAAPPTCSGTEVGGFCWYLGTDGQSCTTVCTGKGGYNVATNTYAGGGGSIGNCEAVLAALSAPGSSPASTSCSFTDNLGCELRSGTQWGYCGVSATSASATVGNWARVCACNN